MGVISEGCRVMNPEDLNWNLKSPCGECPFRKSSPFHVGVAASAPGITYAIRKRVFMHTCHETDNFETCDGPRNWKKDKPEHCAGAILMMLKLRLEHNVGLPFPLLRAVENGQLDLNEMMNAARNADDVFTLNEFLKFQQQGLFELENGIAKEERE